MLIAQITDPHIGLQPGPATGPLDPTGSLRRALAHVRALQPAVGVLLLTGDLADNGRPQDYAEIAALLADTLPTPADGGPRVLAVPGNHDRRAPARPAALRADTLPTPAEGGPRVLAVPGNHDLRAPARQALAAAMPVAPDAPGDCVCLHVEHGGLHLIGLDTVVPGAAHGALAADQLAWLQRHLAACAGAPVLIFMHHPPLVSGMAAMDACGLLQGRAELGRIVAAHGGVQAIAAGHLHRAIVGQLGGAPVVVAPSSSHQLTLDLRPDAPLALRFEPPMIGLYRWTAADGIACHFSYVEAFGPSHPI